MTVQLIDGRGHTLRHIHPTARFASEGGTATLLGRSYGFTWLPTSHIPTSADLVEGSYTRRLGDSGEFTLTFPNSAGKLGLWRERFSEDLALEFIEVYRDDVLEFVGSIQRVEIDRGTVTVSGADAWSLLRRAYERDRKWTAAPREVVEAYTSVPVVVFADEFNDNSIAAGWTASGTTLLEAFGRLKVSNATGNPQLGVNRANPFTTDRWEVTVVYSGSPGTSSEVGIGLFDNTATVRGGILLTPDRTSVFNGAVEEGFTATPANPGDRMPMSVQLRRAGRWLYGYENGRLAGVVPYPTATITTIRLYAVGGFLTGGGNVYIDLATFTELQPFLSRGTDKGDYVLPGDYPTGGLRGRYWDDSRLEGLASATRFLMVPPPNRDPSVERLDPVIDTGGALTLPPDGLGDYYSVRWFGAVYLRGDLGNYTLETGVANGGVRVWVGKTGWGDQLIDAWSAGATTTATWTAANYGADGGWYPIIVDFHTDTGTETIALRFTPPASYTDPGGTSITSGVKITIPTTSLSALGCFDNRVQGTSHFDMVQQTAQTYGYQIELEPMQLESGEFPGRLVPRVRVGRDTDVVLEVEDDPQAEPLLNPGVTLDASDQAVRLVGTGAGISDGQGGQPSAEVTDLASAAAGLFALETWVDAGDVAFPDLLAARLNAELALRGTSWEEVRGTPTAQERLADTWPLSSTLSAMRWRPGDGVRLNIPTIGVVDATPRQMVQVTRTFAAEGRTGTQVAFRQRPRSVGRSVRSSLRAALAPQRSYQRQRVALNTEMVNTGGATIAAAGFTQYGIIALLPGDTVTSAYVRIVSNSANVAATVEINGTDRTTELNGGTGWTKVPMEVDVTGYATQASPTDPRLYIRVGNNGGVGSILMWQLFVEVLR